MFMQCSEGVKYYILLWSITFKNKQTKSPPQCSVNIQTQKPDYSDDDDYSR